MEIDLEKAIRANNDEFEANIRRADAAALVRSFYAENAVLMPPDQPSINGKARITEFWGQMFGAGLKDAKLKTVEIDASGDLACEIGAYTLTMAAAGGATAEAKGKYVVVLRKQADGAWKTIVDIFNGNGG